MAVAAKASTPLRHGFARVAKRTEEDCYGRGNDGMMVEMCLSIELMQT